MYVKYVSFTSLLTNTSWIDREWNLRVSIPRELSASWFYVWTHYNVWGVYWQTDGHYKVQLRSLSQYVWAVWSLDRNCQGRLCWYIHQHLWTSSHTNQLQNVSFQKGKAVLIKPIKPSFQSDCLLMLTLFLHTLCKCCLLHMSIIFIIMKIHTKYKAIIYASVKIT